MGRRRVKKPPMVKLLPFAAVDSDYGLWDLFAAETQWTRHQVRALYGLFAMHSDERAFARALLVHKPHFWLFRSNQRCFCGDFVAVDMSNPVLEQRKVFVMDLKQNTSLKIGGGGAGIQFKNAQSAIQDIALYTGKISPDVDFEKLVGEKDQLLNYFGVVENPSSNS